MKEPQADFSFTGDFYINEPIEFINHSSNADNFIWNFGDDSTSLDISPTHCYADTGRYCITLTAFGLNNSSSMSKYIHIEMILLNEDLPVLCK